MAALSSFQFFFFSWFRFHEKHFCGTPFCFRNNKVCGCRLPSQFDLFSAQVLRACTFLMDLTLFFFVPCSFVRSFFSVVCYFRIIFFRPCFWVILSLEGFRFHSLLLPPTQHSRLHHAVTDHHIQRIQDHSHQMQSTCGHVPPPHRTVRWRSRA